MHLVYSKPIAYQTIAGMLIVAAAHNAQILKPAAIHQVYSHQQQPIAHPQHVGMPEDASLTAQTPWSMASTTHVQMENGL